MTDHDPTLDTLRRLADEAAPAPLSANELDSMLANLPAVPPASSRRLYSQRWWAAAAALVIGLGFGATRLLQQPTPAPSPHVVADATPMPEPRRLEVRMTTSDPTIEVVWILSDDVDF